MSTTRLGYTLALIGGILMIAFGALGLIQATSSAFFFGWWSANGSLVTIIGGVIALLGAQRITSTAWAIVLIAVGVLAGGFSGLLVLIGGILGLYNAAARQV